MGENIHFAKMFLWGMREWYLLSRLATPINEYIKSVNFDDLCPQNDN
jgi:hypothetical protein